MSKKEIDKVIDSFTNPILFKQNEDGSFLQETKILILFRYLNIPKYDFNNRL